MSGRDLHIKFHHYPRDRQKRIKWLQLSGRTIEEADLIPNNTLRICSLHHEDYHSWVCKSLGQQLSGCRCWPKSLPSLRLPLSATVQSPNTGICAKRKLHFNSNGSPKRPRTASRECSPLKVSQTSNCVDDFPLLSEASASEGLSSIDKMNIQNPDDSGFIDNSSTYSPSTPVLNHIVRLSKENSPSPTKNKSWCVTRAERRANKTPSPKIIEHNADTVEIVIFKQERVPPIPVPIDATQNYSSLSKNELIALLATRDREISSIRIEKDALEISSEVNSHEWDKVLKEKNEEIEALKSATKYLAETELRLFEKLRNAYKDGREAGKRELSVILENLFSEAQIKSLMTGKRVTWSPDDIAAAVALHACSRKAYKFVLKKMHIPLPSEATIRRWTSKIMVRPGTQDEVLKILEKISPSLTEEERLLVVCFDEIQLSERAQYDAGRDAVVGPNKHAQVVMIRPLVGNWKQPVHFGYDEEMTPQLFLDITSKLYNIGYKVVASTCDLGPSNRGFLGKIGALASEDGSVNHPCDSNLKIFFFADPPHMIKLLRNHILDSGVKLEGHKVDSHILKKVINLVNRTKNSDVSEMRSFDKLHAGLLDVNAKARMRVRPATQLLSDSTAKALNYFYERGILKDEDAPTAAKVVKAANDWFDVLNSRHNIEGQTVKGPFGSQLDLQLECLHQMSVIVENMRVGSHKSLVPFQHGILLSTKSLINLQRYLDERYMIKSFSTSKLNQDCLESLFAWIRAAGLTYTTPTALDFSYRFKKFILSKSTTHFGKSNCQEDASQNFCHKLLLSNTKKKNPDSNFKSQSRSSECTETSSASLSAHRQDDCEHDNWSGANDNYEETVADLDSLTGLALMSFAPDSAVEASNTEEVNFLPEPVEGEHQMSRVMRNFLDKCAEKNGILSMASFLAQKLPDATSRISANIKYKIENSCLSLTEREALENKDWLIILTSEMEKQFVSFHGSLVTDFSKEEGINQKLSEKISEDTGCDHSLSKLFVRTRLFMRLRDFNLPLRNASMNCINKSYAKYYS